MAEILGCRVGSLSFSYLGIRVGSNHRRLSEWSFIIQKVKNRLRKWDDKKISLGGRITLLNSVLSAIPIYYLSLYHIPKKIVREITSIQRKWGWRFLNEGGSLWARVVKSKYGEAWGGGYGRLPTGRVGKVSLWWKDILKITDDGNGRWFGANLEKVMGDGVGTLFWEEDTGEGALRDRFHRLYITLT
ncbi:hypothetical protein ACS0TY_028397 [Phlomoides rotata]